MIGKLVRYCIFGGMGVTLDFVVFAGLLYVNVSYLAANVAGYLAGTLLSFALNRKFTFGIKDNAWLRLASFVSVAMLGLAGSTLLLWFLVDIAHMNPILAKFATLVFVVAFQFTLNNLITFRLALKPNG